MMGRFQNGNSLYHDTPTLSNQHLRDDPNGAVCPLFSHVRRMRLSSQQHSIVRRGGRYRIKAGNKVVRGMLFVSYQKDINKQLLPYLQGMKKGGDIMVYPQGVRDSNVHYTLSPLKTGINVPVNDLEKFKPFAARFTDVLNSTSMIIPSKRFISLIGTDELYRSSADTDIIS